MYSHSLMCPVDFKAMVNRTRDGQKIGNQTKLDQLWDSYSMGDLIPYLTWELFYYGNKTSSQLLSFLEERMESLEEEWISQRDFLERILDPVNDPDYMEIWKGVKDIPNRVLFYACNHDRRRLKKVPGYEQTADIEYFLEVLDSLHVDTEMKIDGMICISDMTRGNLVYLKPCCPHCHTILPDKWFIARSYLPISLLAPAVGGKTTLISSWMVENYQAFRFMGNLGRNCSVVDGMFYGDREFPIQKYFRQIAEKLYYKGIYPDRDEETRKPPLYTRIIHYTDEVVPETGKKEEYLLVGTYDIAGETLRKLRDDDIDPELTEYLTYMKAFIYLISPEQMNNLSVTFRHDQKESFSEICGGRNSVISLEEQGKLQNKNYGRVISAADLFDVTDDDILGPWDIFNRVDSKLTAEGTKGDQHFAFTISKCDLIMNLPEILEICDAGILFSNPLAHSAMSKEYIFSAGLEAKRIFERFTFRGTEEEQRAYMKILANEEDNRNGYRSISWHCVSACIPRVSGKGYQHIRRTDPLVACLQSEMDRLGWD